MGKWSSIQCHVIGGSNIAKDKARGYGSRLVSGTSNLRSMIEQGSSCAVRDNDSGPVFEILVPSLIWQRPPIYNQIHAGWLDQAGGRNAA